MNPQRSGKRFKSFLRAWTITGVSLVSILGPGPREINLERTFLKNLENLSGKKVNNGINKPSATNVLKKSHRKIKPNGPLSDSYRLPNLLESLRKNPTCNLTYSTNPGDKIKIKHSEHLSQCHKFPIAFKASSYSLSLFSFPSLSSISPFLSPFPLFLLYGLPQSVKNLQRTSCSDLPSCRATATSTSAKNSRKELIDSESLTERSTESSPLYLPKEPAEVKALISGNIGTKSSGLSGDVKDGRHLLVIIILRLRRSQDVESNPGPTPGAPGTPGTSMSEVKVISYNVRGLNDELKLRHLVNNCYKLNRNLAQDFVICLQ